MKKVVLVLLALFLVLFSFYYVGVRYVPDVGMSRGATYYQPTTTLADKGEKQEFLGIEFYYLNYSYTFKTSSKNQSYVLTYSITLKDADVYVVISVTADWRRTILNTEIIYHEDIFHETIDYTADQGANASYSNRVVIDVPDRNEELLSLSLNLLFAGDGNAKISGIEYLGIVQLKGIIGLGPVILVYGISLLPLIFAFKSGKKKY